MLKNAHVLLDTNIVSNVLSKETDLVSKTQAVLEELNKNGNSFYVSQLTKYELLRSADDKQRDKCKKYLGKLVQIDINENRLDRATRLYSLYKNRAAIKNHLHSISDIDVFIGSLIFTDKNTYLLTADGNDFPRPFFLETQVWCVEYVKKQGQKAFMHYYLLKANLSEF